MTLHVAWHRGAGALQSLEGEYRELVGRSRHATLFNEWPWIAAAAAHGVAAGRAIRTLAVRSDGRLVGCLPMTWGRESILGLPVRTLRPLGYPLSDRIGIPLDEDTPGVFTAIAGTLADGKTSEADVAILSELPTGYRIRLAESSGRRAPHIRPCARSPVLDVSNPDRLKAEYPKSLRTRLSRARKKIHESGETRFERILPEPADVPALLDTISAIEKKSWKGVAGVGIFSTPERYALFRSMALSLASEGRLEILLYRLNGEVVSYRFGFRSGQTYYDYNFAHPLALDALSVGRLLLADAIETAATAGIATFDASRGSLDKPNILSDWTEGAIEHDEIWLFARTVWGDLLRLAVVKAKPLAKRVLRRMEAA